MAGRRRQRVWVARFGSAFRSKKMQLLAFGAWRQQSALSKHQRLSAARMALLFGQCCQRNGFYHLRQFARRRSDSQQHLRHLVSLLQMTLVALRRKKKAEAFAALRRNLSVCKSQGHCWAARVLAATARRSLLRGALTCLLLHVRNAPFPSVGVGINTGGRRHGMSCLLTNRYESAQ